MIERLLEFIYGSVAFPFLRTRSGVNPLVVYYHIVSDLRVPHIENLYAFRTEREFERDVDTLLKFYSPISLQDFLAHLNGRQSLAANAFLLTFDDGLRECHEIIAPILKRKGVPATFFLCSAFVDNKELAYDLKRSLLECRWRQGVEAGQQRAVGEILKAARIVGDDTFSSLRAVDYRRRNVLDEIAKILGEDFPAYQQKIRPYLDSTEIRDLLREGHAMGAHSIDHPRYMDLTLDEQLRQTRESLRFVKGQFALEYGAFSFPHSDANVSREFFNRIMGAGELDLCFGNQGLLDDRIPKNVQRTAMEKTRLPAEAILGKSYLRRILKRAGGNLQIVRH